MFIRKIIAFCGVVALVWPPFLVAAQETGPRVIINELLWMGSSVSAFDEWIELRNMTDQEVDLAGWYLTRKLDGQETLMLTVPEGEVLEPHGFFMIANYSAASPNSSLANEPDLVDTAVSLVNTQLQIKLYSAAGGLEDVADDGSGKPLAGEYVSGEKWASMERNDTVSDGTQAGSWHSAGVSDGFKTGTEFGTPDQINSNSPPVADAGEDFSITAGEIAQFDGSESFDPDGDALSFAWDFGDGATGVGPTPTHVFEQAGDFTTTLTVSDGSLTTVDSIVVTVRPRPVFAEETKPLYDPFQQHPVDQPGAAMPKARLRLTELLPNPAGLDKEGEFIEIYNAETKAVSLVGWQLEVGSRKYTFPAVTIAAQDHLALGYQTTRLVLANAGATVALKNPDGRAVDTVTYPAGEENHSFALIDGQWRWTAELTPGEENVLKQQLGVAAISSAQMDAAVEPLTVSLAEAHSLDLRTKVLVTGIVSVAPGTFGSQYFYLFDGAAGIQVYSSKKAFPDLTVGDEVQVTGSIGQSAGEKKINVAAKEDIVIKQAATVPPALELNVGSLTDELVGSLVSVTGTVSNLTRTQFTLRDGDDSITVAIKRGTGIGAPPVSEEQSVAVTGVLSFKEGEQVVFPRSNDDLLTEGNVLGDKAAGEETVTLAGQPTNSLLPWLVITSVLLLGGGGYWYWRRRRLKANAP